MKPVGTSCIRELYSWVKLGWNCLREVTEGLISFGNQAKMAAPRPNWQKLIYVSDHTRIWTKCNMGIHMLENCRGKCASSGPPPNDIKDRSPPSTSSWWWMKTYVSISHQRLTHVTSRWLGWAACSWIEDCPAMHGMYYRYWTCKEGVSNHRATLQSTLKHLEVLQSIQSWAT